MSMKAAAGLAFIDLARDPLVRLVMASDGVTEAAFVAVMETAQRAVDARAATGRHCDAAPRRPMRRLRAVPASVCHSAWM
jgi:hypothetical protein